MSNKLFHSLPYRTGLRIAFSAAGLTIILSYAMFQYTVDQVVADLNHRIKQLVSTVENTAAVAAFVDNQELALEVTRGLADNDIVEGASLQSLSGMRIIGGEPFSVDSDGVQVYPLASPFMEEEQVGVILIRANNKYINQQALKSALVSVMILAIQALLLTLLVISLVNRLLTEPLKSVAHELHTIEPGSNSRINCPKNHDNSEIGLLVQDTNNLLAAAQYTLEGERRLREYIEALQQKTRIEAERDPLTQLLNRRAGERAIQEALARCQTNSLKAAVILIDLDGFKPINDVYGHDAGDAVLVEVSQRLTTTLRQNDILIRWGGDEFVIMAVQGHDRLEAAVIGKKLLTAIIQPMLLHSSDKSEDQASSVQITVGASIGIAIYPDHATDSGKLFDLADKAMYHIKHSGKHGFFIHETNIQ